MAVTTPEDSARWIRRFAPADDAATRLVCLPHAGGSASFFVPYATALHPRTDVLAVQYPGRQDRWCDPLIDNMSDLADAATDALRPWLDRPFALFGHSMGASLAFEVAGRLTRDGSVPTHLFASGRRAPSCHRDGEHIHLKSDDAIVAELAAISGTDPSVLAEPELLAMVLPGVRNDFRVAETYRSTGAPPLTCPITVLIGDEDPRVSFDEAQAWRAHTTGAFDVRIFPGGHFYLVDNRNGVLEVLSSR